VLKIQEWLLSDKNLQNLKDELGIKATLHPSLPLMILNYDMIDSPKTNQIVREARGLILESTFPYNLVARSFFRFYNWGEVASEMDLFDWKTSFCQEKCDGSLILLWFYDGKWQISTRGSFANLECGFSGRSWSELFFETISLEKIEQYCKPGTTYVFEFCSLHNKIVRSYPSTSIYLLTQFCGENELSQESSDEVASQLGCLRPNVYNFKNIEDVQAFLTKQGAEDATFEGFVICDSKNLRWKIKNPLYLALHKCRGEGDNLYNPKNLLPFILSGEEAELILYFPEVKETFYAMKKQVDESYDKLASLWEQTKNIVLQKNFALSVVPYTKFSSLLFQLRKNQNPDVSLRDLWQKSEDLILKVLFKG
jgi:hypothetical protein